MSEEKIFTQEEFNDKLGEVLAKKQKKFETELAAKQTEIDGLNRQIEDLNTKVTSFDETIATKTRELEESQAKLKGYETNSAKRKVADELGLDSKAIEFISGETEEEMKASAEKLKALTGGIAPPLATVETESKDKVTEAFMELNNKIKVN